MYIIIYLLHIKSRNNWGQIYFSVEKLDLTPISKIDPTPLTVDPTPIIYLRITTILYAKADIKAVQGIVSTHAQIILPATPHLTALMRFNEPIPTIEPVIVCVVLTGMPKKEETFEDEEQL